jgi:hypothetical protein
MGKIKKPESGAPAFNVVALDTGNVAIQFSERINGMVFTPDQARALGVGLIEMATRVHLLTLPQKSEFEQRVEMASRSHASPRRLQ